MTEVDVLAETVIDCPRDQVASYAADPDNVPNWYVNIKSVAWKTPRPAVVGSQIAFVAHFLGRRLEYTYEIVDLTPRERLVMRTAGMPQAIAGRLLEAKLGVVIMPPAKSISARRPILGAALDSRESSQKTRPSGPRHRVF